ncbi:MAG: tetratricopeptide repeat protein [Deltaproteobacteria bacterium]|nr:tetratricopeptide repeat protein [Deltaproteobacteria bacterium]
MLANVAMVARVMGDHASSSRHYHEARTIAEATLGPNHPDVATLLNDIAICRRRTATCEVRGGLFEARAGDPRARARTDHPQVARAPAISRERCVLR